MGNAFNISLVLISMPINDQKDNANELPPTCQLLLQIYFTTAMKISGKFCNNETPEN